MTDRKSVIWLLFFSVIPLLSADAQEPFRAYPADSLRLYVMARDIWAPVELQSRQYVDLGIDESQSTEKLRQASLLLQSAVEMDPGNALAWHDLMLLLSSPAIDDPGRATDAMNAYSSLKPQDSSLIEKWLRYRLEGFSDRKTREYFLGQTYPQLKNYPDIQSEILIELGMMSLEKGDTETARANFAQAFMLSRYNSDALLGLLELPLPLSEAVERGEAGDATESQRRLLEEQRIIQAVLHQRLRLFADPYSLDATLAMIDVLEGLGSDKQAQDYYEHALSLLAGQPEHIGLRAELQLKQLVGAYKGGRYQLCLTIAEQAQKERPNDLLVSGISAMAMKKLGMDETASRVLTRASKNALARLEKGAEQSQDQSSQNNAKRDLRVELAWFYCFIDPDPAQGLTFAEAAAGEFGDDYRGVNTLAYAHVMNRQWDKAEKLLKDSDSQDPIAALAWAGILLSRNEKDAALEKLKGVNINLAGILAEKITGEILNLEPKPVVDTDLSARAGQDIEQAAAAQVNRGADLVDFALNSNFDGNDLLLPHEPQKFINCRMRFDTDVFSYGDPMIARIYLTNIGQTDIPLGAKSFLDPRVLIAAEVAGTAGSDKKNEAVMLLACRYLNQEPVLRSGRSNIAAESLNIGPLRDILDKYPQRTFHITFRLYLEPLSSGFGGLLGRIPQLQPEPITVVRRGFVPTRSRMSLQKRLLRNGSPDDKIRATRLLGGLLREAEMAEKGELLYTPRPIDINFIRRAIIDNLADSDFRVRSWSAYALGGLDISETAFVAERLGRLLNDSHWFVRFMAGESLRESGAGMAEYLKRTATTDDNQIVRRQAQLKLSQQWETIEVPLNIPEEPPAESVENSGTAIPTPNENVR